MPEVTPMGSVDWDALAIDAQSPDWSPPFWLLTKNEREQLGEDEQRNRARNRIGIYELRCPRCGRPGVTQVRRDDDGEVWLCPDCRGTS